MPPPTAVMIPPRPVETLEVRWFLPGPLPEQIEAWMRGLDETTCAEERRTDTYLRPSGERAAGIKLREGGVEVKQLLGRHDASALWPGGPTMPLETWAKWRFGCDAVSRSASAEAGDAPDGWLHVAKMRLRRTYVLDGDALRSADPDDAPGRASASLEVGAVRTVERRAWTLCLEASGPSAEARHRALVAAARLLATFPSDARHALAPHNAASYPAWLCAHRYAGTGPV